MSDDELIWPERKSTTIKMWPDQEYRALQATIAELEKRIGELEREKADWDVLEEGSRALFLQLDQALTAERQRRQELEVIAQDHAVKTTFQTFVRELKAYFSRYPSES